MDTGGSTAVRLIKGAAGPAGRAILLPRLAGPFYGTLAAPQAAGVAPLASAVGLAAALAAAWREGCAPALVQGEQGDPPFRLVLPHAGWQLTGALDRGGASQLPMAHWLAALDDDMVMDIVALIRARAQTRQARARESRSRPDDSHLRAATAHVPIFGGGETLRADGLHWPIPTPTASPDNDVQQARRWLRRLDEALVADILPLAVAAQRARAAFPARTPVAVRLSELDRADPAPQPPTPGLPRAARREAPQLPALVEPAVGAETRVDGGADPLALEQILLRGDVVQLRRIWASILMSQRATFRRIWQALPADCRERAIERCIRRLSLVRRTDLAAMLQPAVTRLLAELMPRLARHSDRHAILDTSLRFLLRAEVGSVTPAQFMQVLLDRHPSLSAALSLDPGRHSGAALRAAAAAPAARAAMEQAIALTAAQRSEPALRAYVLDQRDRATQFSQLNSAQLHGLVQAWAGFQAGAQAAATLLPAVEARALGAGAPHAFFGMALRQMVLGEGIDFDQIDADSVARVPVPMSETLPGQEWTVRHAGPGVASAPAHDGISPLSALVCQALPQRLAEALLRADLSALDTLWPAIVRYHPDLLKRAAQRYLGRAEARHRLIDRADAGKMHDLLACLCAPAAQLVAPLLQDSASFSALLPAPLASRVFQQRVLRYALAQVMDLPSSSEAVAWLTGLLRSLLPPAPHSPQSQASLVLALHAWYELSRSGASSLKGVLEQALFGSACLQAVLQRLRGASCAATGTSLPEILQPALMLELCHNYPALTDCLLTQGALLDIDAAAFTAAEWQALARAQLPRQERAVQLAFRRAYFARLPAPVEDHGQTEAEVQEAFAAAFGLLRQPVTNLADSAGPGQPSDPALAAASADSIAILLMGELVPDEAVQASLLMLTQRLLANLADGGAGATARAGTDNIDGNGSSADVNNASASASLARATLRSALRHRRAIDRLAAILPEPVLARLLCELQPALAGALPTVLRIIGDSLPNPLPAVPLMLDRSIWHTIFDTIFVGPVPGSAGALLAGLGERLAVQHPHAVPGWQLQVDTLARAGASLAIATPAAAMALLLRPLTAPDPQALSAARIDPAAAPFSGDSNLRNAGLVLIAPYIERLFAMLNITHDGQFVSEETRQRGVHLLQYAVSAEEATPEYLLALNKLLCGIPASVPVAAGIGVTDKEKTAIEQLLKSVISHWSAIGASTVAGLRDTFLQREGCLYYQEEAWRLLVPQGTFDMLLDRLPWGYKLIKFSWMAAPLNVTWR